MQEFIGGTFSINTCEAMKAVHYSTSISVFREEVGL